MLYFAYGSNLNHFQMKKRCKDSKFLKKFDLKENYFCHGHFLAWIPDSRRFQPVPGRKFHVESEFEVKNILLRCPETEN